MSVERASSGRAESESLPPPGDGPPMDPLYIGTVIQVDAEGVEVLLTRPDMEIQQEGTTYRVGQLGGYIALPRDKRTLVGFVTAVGRREAPDPDAAPQLILSCQLLGTITCRHFLRGVNDYPVIGDPVRVATDEDFAIVFGSQDEEAGGVKRSFRVGSFALNPDFPVRVLGKEFLSKHAAIMGNSGSGKSCTTARVVQELITLPDAQIVLFDLHGEYSAAFSDEEGKLHDNVTYLGERDLIVPYWLLKYEELEDLFVDMTNPSMVSNQVTFLKEGVGLLKAPAAEEKNLVDVMTLDTPAYFPLDRLLLYALNMNEARYVLGTEQFAFAKLAQRSMEIDEQKELLTTRRCGFNKGNPENEIPHAMYNGKLLGLIQRLETRLNDRRYDFMLRPLEQAKRSPIFRDVLRPDATPGELTDAMADFVKVILGRRDPRRNLTIVDMSGVPFDIVDIAVAVLTRLLFDYNFWSPPSQRHPTLLVYEEAHNYIPRVANDKCFARAAVEKVAKEGRKYGVTAMIISQRPSELSETVLSQCNNMVVMRLNNPDDQAYVRRVVSDQFANLVRMLPILRPGEAFVIGDAVLMPLRTLIDLPTRLPRSGDVDFMKHWSEGTPDADVNSILEHWWRQDRRLLNAPKENAAREAPLDVPIPGPSATTPRERVVRPSATHLTSPSGRPLRPPGAASE
jgi:DNA helicase HerA-like ATPase